MLLLLSDSSDTSLSASMVTVILLSPLSLVEIIGIETVMESAYRIPGILLRKNFCSTAGIGSGNLESYRIINRFSYIICFCLQNKTAF